MRRDNKRRLLRGEENKMHALLMTIYTCRGISYFITLSGIFILNRPVESLCVTPLFTESTCTMYCSGLMEGKDSIME